LREEEEEALYKLLIWCAAGDSERLNKGEEEQGFYPYQARVEFCGCSASLKVFYNTCWRRWRRGGGRGGTGSREGGGGWKEGGRRRGKGRDAIC
jgi:hypothetical protein